jgi:hypothetical protein
MSRVRQAQQASVSENSRSGWMGHPHPYSFRPYIRSSRFLVLAATADGEAEQDEVGLRGDDPRLAAFQTRTGGGGPSELFGLPDLSHHSLNKHKFWSMRSYRFVSSKQDRFCSTMGFSEAQYNLRAARSPGLNL